MSRAIPGGGDLAVKTARQVLGLSVVLAAGWLAMGATAGAVSGTANGYRIDVAPTSQDAGKAVTVTGNGQYYTAPFSGDNCDSTTITVTVTYYNLAKAQETRQVTLGTSDGNGDLSGPVTIPSDAAPTSFTGHDAEVQASCTNDSAFLSNVVPVAVNGTVATTTTTVAPTSTTASTTTTVAPTSTTASTVIAAATTTTVVPPTQLAVTTTTAAAAALPRTGGSSAPLAGIALGALTLGLAAIGLTRRRSA